MTAPLRNSALASTMVPAMVTGLVAPIWGAGIISAGMPCSAQSRRFWQVTSLHIRGLLGQQSNMARGSSGSPPPATAPSMFFMSVRPVLVNAPVTMGFEEFLSMT